jgi:glutamine amidotransferase
MICIIDYGVGNIQPYLTLFKQIGVKAGRVSTPDQLSLATHLILPGVGHFDHAIKSLNNSGMRTSLENLVLKLEIPIMGVCVGMQILADSSEEGDLPGLGWVPGSVRAFAGNPQSATLPMPHMGWNELEPKNDSKLFSYGIDKHSEFYFLHSFYFEAQDKNDVAATARYGLDFDAAISRRNIYGVQFHPEKSHHCGRQLLLNFLKSQSQDQQDASV